MPDLFANAGVPLPQAAAPVAAPPKNDAAAPRAKRDGRRDPSVLWTPERQVDAWAREPDGWPSVTPRLITPELVAANPLYLKMPGKDGPYEAKVEELVRAIKEGWFAHLGRTIVEARNGLILDGIKVLKAVHDSGVPVTCLWVSGIEKSALCAMDLRKGRGASITDATDGIAAAGLGVGDPLRLLGDLDARRPYAWRRLTPAGAEAILAQLDIRGIPYRKPDKDDPLVRDVAAGRFLRTGQPLVFARGGILRDGALRCGAVILANRPIDILMVYDVDPAIPARCFGVGGSRTFGRTMQAYGVGAAYDLASSLVLLRQIDVPAADPTRTELFDMYHGNRLIRGAMSQSQKHQEHIAQSIHVAARTYLLERHPVDKVTAFLSAVLPRGDDPSENKEFRRRSSASMAPGEARAARKLWRRLGDKAVTGKPAERLELVNALVSAYHRFHGLPWRRRRAGRSLTPPAGR